MKVDVNGTQIDLAPNSKPYLLKRIAADGFDTVLIFALFMLFTMLILKTPAANVYHAHFDRYTAIEADTAAALNNDAEAVSRALSENDEYRNELFAANLHGYLLKAGACLLAEGLLLLAVPLLNRNRCTPGKLMVGVMPFSERRQSRAVPWQVIARFLFVFLIDSLAWYLFTGILTFLLVPLLRLTEMLLNRKNKTICDWMTGVLVIEKLSYDGIN
jgi:hypothetical protein